LKPVLAWKVFYSIYIEFISTLVVLTLITQVKPVEEYILKATDAKTIILDAEILLMDSKTRQPLPFGTLNVHKKTQVIILSLHLLLRITVSRCHRVCILIRYSLLGWEGE
jgi:hypothetical protein